MRLRIGEAKESLLREFRWAADTRCAEILTEQNMRKCVELLEEQHEELRHNDMPPGQTGLHWRGGFLENDTDFKGISSLWLCRIGENVVSPGRSHWM